MLNTRPTGPAESGATQQTLAVLIDADNAQALVIDELLAEVARFGEATVRRIYGDFTSPQSTQWKKVLNKYAIKPVQQFAYTTGKNATDSRLIIDAMDLLHKGIVRGFCLVSSDSDFTGLAIRIREEGLMVYGFGVERTPEAFRNACNKFIFIENLRDRVTSDNPDSMAPTVIASQQVADTTASNQDESQPETAKKPIPIELLREAFEKNSDDAEWVYLSALGDYLTRVQSGFDPRSFGFKKLKDLFMALPEHFECKEEAVPNSPTGVIYVRMR